MTEPQPSRPLVCDMSNARDTPQERMSEYGRLFDHALIGRERTSAGLAFRFEPQPGVAEWICDLSQREAACCPFFDYTISTTDDGEITWRIATDGDSVAESILDEMYQLPDITAGGFPGLLHQLGAAGLTIETSHDGQVTSVT